METANIFELPPDYTMVHQQIQPFLKSASIELELNSDINNIPAAISYILHYLQNYDVQPAIQSRIRLGLTETLLHSIAYHNLELNQWKKAFSVSKEDWYKELERRSQLPEYQNKKLWLKVYCEYQKEILITLQDEGDGFSHSMFERDLDDDFQTRAVPFGRGLAVVEQLSDGIVFNEQGQLTLCYRAPLMEVDL